jgi:hypothetical protein
VTHRSESRAKMITKRSHAALLHVHSYRALLLAACLAAACVQESLAFASTGILGHVDSVLGSDAFSRLNLETGFVDATESRVNVFGERSTVSYHLKPHAYKLKVQIDHACFAIKCYDGKIIISAKSNHFTHRSSSSDSCLFSSVTAMTSSAHFTGRAFAFSSTRPSLFDLRSGDFLYGNLKCSNAAHAAAFKITSFFQMTRNARGAGGGGVFEIGVRPATILDVVSEGEYTFHTDNLLTVNDVAHRVKPKPRLFDKEWADTFNQDMIDLVRPPVPLAQLSPHALAISSAQALFIRTGTTTSLREKLPSP